LIGAAANWGVAHVLREPSKEDMAIRLAYVHNLGDTMVSLVPVAAGILVFPSENSLFDSLFALLIAAIIVITTPRLTQGAPLPENVSCGHSGTEQGV
jgi:Co/Zn/Cd efflux system component